jgi:hypothetical protein
MSKTGRKACGLILSAQTRKKCPFYGLFWETNDDLQARKRKAAPSEAEPFETGCGGGEGRCPSAASTPSIRVGGGTSRITAEQRRKLENVETKNQCQVNGDG